MGDTTTTLTDPGFFVPCYGKLIIAKYIGESISRDGAGFCHPRLTLITTEN